MTYANYPKCITQMFHPGLALVLPWFHLDLPTIMTLSIS